MGNHEGNLQELVEAVGVIAKMSFLFYRAVLGAGADDMEAERLTQAYIAVLLSRASKGKEETS